MSAMQHPHPACVHSQGLCCTTYSERVLKLYGRRQPCALEHELQVSRHVTATLEHTEAGWGRGLWAATLPLLLLLLLRVLVCTVLQGQRLQLPQHSQALPVRCSLARPVLRSIERTGAAARGRSAGST